MKPEMLSLRDLADRLLEYEAGSNDKSSGPAARATLRVCEKFRNNLGSLMGTSGFAALLARALVLARPDVSFLRTVQAKADGSLQEFESIKGRVSSREIAEGGAVLITRLLGLLVAFIGYNLTCQLLREVWPKLPLEDFTKKQ
jgi:hypothetical protein